MAQMLRSVRGLRHEGRGLMREFDVLRRHSDKINGEGIHEAEDERRLLVAFSWVDARQLQGQGQS